VVKSGYGGVGEHLGASQVTEDHEVDGEEGFTYTLAKSASVKANAAKSISSL
jgi:hypothetical protein